MPPKPLLLGAIFLLIALAKWAMYWTRERDIDGNGNPIARYLGPRIVTTICGLFLVAFGIFQWLAPANHRYPGNLFLLCYLPLAAASLIFVLAAYFWTYRLTLLHDRIEIKHWPLRTIEHSLTELQSVEALEKLSILRFKDGSSLRVYAVLSGGQFIIERFKV